MPPATPLSDSPSGSGPTDDRPVVEAAKAPHPSFGDALRFWFKLGLISFGGPAGQIAIMHAELVDRKRWISESRFLHALNYCMLLPGPEAQQLATYVGWLLHGTAGGIVAGGLFVIPSAFLLWALSWIYLACGDLPWIAAAFAGLKPVVVAIVAAAVLRIGRRALKNAAMWTLAGAAFIAIFFLEIPFPLIILSAGVTGLAGYRLAPRLFTVIEPHGITGHDAAVIGDRHSAPDHATPSFRRSIRVLAACLLLWWTPILVAGGWLGWNHTLYQEGAFFSKAAMVTFGGAYAVLPYVAQQAVERFGWLAPGQMLDGLGLAETTPGPLIMVVQFVGFVGAWQHPGGWPPLLAATLGAALSTWATFLPCFLWILLGAPYIERLRDNRRLSAALSAITAAVVGVVLNLAVWFAGHAIIPSTATVNWFAAATAIAAFIAMVRWKVDILVVVASGATLGIAHKLFTT